MKSPSTHMLSLLASAVFTTVFLVACQQSQPPVATPAGKDVFVVFEGPWAVVPDPKDANSVLLLAPKTKAHRGLYVTASNVSALEAGTYDLTVPARTGPAAGTFDDSILRTRIDPKSVQSVLDDKSEHRYVIRLPKPDAYMPAARHHSRVSASYPPDPAVEKEYASEVSLRYNTSSLNGFSLAGATDSGKFDPFLIRVETPTIRFVINPDQEPDPADKCNTHSRQSFHEVTTLLALNLYVDFPESPSSCHDTDPQKPHAVKAETTGFERLLALSQSQPEHANKASMIPLGTGRFTMALLYLFGHPSGVCISPIIAADGS
jgi:hypothetical protein